MPVPQESLIADYRATVRSLEREIAENEAFISRLAEDYQALAKRNHELFLRYLDFETERELREDAVAYADKLEAQVKSLESRVRYLEAKETLRTFLDEFLKPKPIIEKPRRSSANLITWTLTSKAT